MLQTSAQNIIYFYDSIFSEKSLKKMVFCLILFGILPLLAFYFFQLGQLFQENYFAKNYQSQIDEISSQNATLQKTTRESLSLGEIEKGAKELKLVEISAIKFLSLTDESLVKNFLVPKSR